MRLCCIFISLFLSLAIFIGCGGDSANDDDDDVVPNSVAENGEVQGTVIDQETHDPVKDASVNIGGEVVKTDADGKYVVQEVPFAENIDIIVTSSDYVEYNGIITVDRTLVIFNINLVPVDSQSARILELLDSLSKDLEALDPGKASVMQSYLSEDYAAAQDLTTSVGVSAGVVPANYDEFPDTILTIVDKYDVLEFAFANPDVELNGESATVWMRFDVYAETKPNPPAVPAKKWEIVVDGRLDLRNENDDWKITYWQLIPPFLTFKEEPLEP